LPYESIFPGLRYFLEEEQADKSGALQSTPPELEPIREILSKSCLRSLVQ